MKTKSRRPNLNFYRMGIPKGATIQSVDTGESATVVNERTITFRNEVMYLTQATKIVLKKYNNPCRHWTYNGKSLQELYEAVY